MSAHLRVPAIDPDLPATLSRPVMTELLRRDLGFTGLVVTDGIEMRAVAGRLGIARAAVMAVAAGADAVCVGGEHADEGTAVAVRDGIVDAVVSGALDEERLVDAAGRVARLAAWSVQAIRDAAAANAALDGAGLGVAAARRAIRSSPGLPVVRTPHVVEFQPELNLAIAPRTPWGVADPLARLVPGTTAMRVTPADEPAPLVAAAGRSLVLVVRDVHRHPWMADAVHQILADRPDAVVVEMGVPVATLGAVHVATYGATSVSGQAAAELLAGLYRPV
jgi:beta-N-acetylhexosaminidase